jgi:hypothetical protein
VRLPQKNIDNEHYYLHVSGELVTGNPDFSETGAAPGGPLRYRPNYVPMLVPIFDEAATNAAKAAYQQAVAGGARG